MALSFSSLLELNPCAEKFSCGVITGGTIPSYRVRIDAEIASWKPFKDALRQPEKDILENMLLRSKLYASAASMAVRPAVFEPMVISILLDHHIRLLELGMEIERIRAPERAKEPKGIEKLLQPPNLKTDSCQAATEATPARGNS